MARSLRTAVVTLFFFASLPAAAQSQATAANTDGHWWLAAHSDERNSLIVGRVVCHTDMLRGGGASVPGSLFESVVTEFYRRHPRRLDMPVVEVIARLERRWRAAKTYPWLKARRLPMYDGDDWWPRAPDDRAALILGFVSCQSAEQGLRVLMTAPELARRVSVWYGVHDLGDGVVNPAREHDALYRVILRAEKAR